LITGTRLRLKAIVDAETSIAELCWNWGLPLESEAAALIEYFPYSTPEKLAETTCAALEEEIGTVCGAGVASPESRGVRLTVSVAAEGRISRETDLDEDGTAFAGAATPSTRKDSSRSDLPPAPVPLDARELWQAPATIAVSRRAAIAEREATKGSPFFVSAMRFSFV
jgi:hypothetical protein